MWNITRKHHAGFGVSYEDMGVPFQWCGVLDLRDKDVVAGTVCDDGHFGVYLKEPYASMPLQEFHLEIKRMFNQKIYGE